MCLDLWVRYYNQPESLKHVDFRFKKIDHA